MGEVHWSSRKTKPWRFATRFATRFAAAAGSRSSRTCLVSRGPHTAGKVRSAAAMRRRAHTHTCDASVHSAGSVSATVAKCFRSFPVERDGPCFAAGNEPVVFSFQNGASWNLSRSLRNWTWTVWKPGQ